jgi:hypothetical protein
LTKSEHGRNASSDGWPGASNHARPRWHAARNQLGRESGR